MTESFRADLHCHSSCSDGQLSPEEMVALAADIGLQGLSLTDHDTVAGYDAAAPVAARHGIKLLSGVEISSTHKGAGVHVLAYAFPLDSALMACLLDGQRQRRQERVFKIIESLARQGMPLDPEDLSRGALHAVGRLHVAAAMVGKGFVRSAGEAFRKFLGEGKACFVPSEAVTVEEAIDTIHRAGGLAVLAHPVLIKKNHLLKALLSMDFDGLEAYYGTVAAAEQRRIASIAKNKGWLATGGSDFHGEGTRYSTLGSSWTPPDVFEILYAHYAHS